MIPIDCRVGLMPAQAIKPRMICWRGVWACHLRGVCGIGGTAREAWDNYHRLQQSDKLGRPYIEV